MKKEKKKFKLWSELHPEVEPKIKRALFWFNLRRHPVVFIKSIVWGLFHLTKKD